MIMNIYTEILGCLAGVLTSYAYFPQIIKLWKTKQAMGISIPTYLFTFFGCLIWFIYGIFHHSIALIIFNSINLVTSSLIMFLTKKI